MSITVSGNVGDAPPPIIGAILDAVHGMVSDLEKAQNEAKSEENVKLTPVETGKIDGDCRIGGSLHLEALHLIGELEAACRAARALKLELAGVDADGIKAAGHAFKVLHHGQKARATRFMKDVVQQERNARVRLFEEFPRVFGDSLCRALAILKNCRLLAPGELFDLLSPLRLAAIERMLDGIDLAEIERMLAGIDLSGAEERLSQEERDRIDAERADEMNRRFEDVVLNERAEDRFLKS
jgi:protein arginine kinase